MTTWSYLTRSRYSSSAFFRRRSIDFGGVGAAADEAAAQDLEVGGRDEDVQAGLAEQLELIGALDVDLEQEHLAALERVLHRLAQRAVEVAVHLGVLDEGALADQLRNCSGVMKW
jgi:hypothetical protein